jgi:hypothetical protein
MYPMPCLANDRLVGGWAVILVNVQSTSMLG